MKLTIKELKIFVKEVLFEKRRLHTNRYEDAKNKLESYLDKGLFFHMTDDPTLNFVNVNSDHLSPLGIYVFPLTSSFVNDFFNKTKRNTFTFLKYIVIYESISNNYIKTSTYTWDDLNKDASFLKKTIKKNIKSPVRAFLELFNPTEQNYRINVNIALKKLGYVGIFDDIGDDVINPKDGYPIQGFFISSQYLNIVNTIDNPKYLWLNYTKHSNRKEKVDLNKIKKVANFIENNFYDSKKHELISILNDLSLDEQLALFDTDLAPWYPFWLYIKNPHKNIRLLGIQYVPESILSFNDVTSDERLKAINIQPKLISSLDNPSEQEIELAAKRRNISKEEILHQIKINKK